MQGPGFFSGNVLRLVTKSETDKVAIKNALELARNAELATRNAFEAAKRTISLLPNVATDKPSSAAVVIGLFSPKPVPKGSLFDVLDTVPTLDFKNGPKL